MRLKRGRSYASNLLDNHGRRTTFAAHAAVPSETSFS